MKRWSFLLGLAAGLTFSACGDSAPTPGEAPTVVGLAPPAPVIVSDPPKKEAPFDRVGGTIARIPGTEQLVVASEELGGLALLKPNGETSFVKLAGPPGQVLASPTGVWVTVRTPARLLLLNEKLEEKASVELPNDAWGLALTPDDARLIVTSAWSHKVTILDAAKFERGEGGLIKTLDVRREPRAIAIAPDGSRAYVTHLTFGSLTRIDGVMGDPEVRAVEFPAAPLRAPSGEALPASLAYSAVYRADGSRLYVARHALGAMGRGFWFGAPTVDVLTTADETPFAPNHLAPTPGLVSKLGKYIESFGSMTPSNFPMDHDGIGGQFPFVVPRDLRARPSRGSLLVVGESSSTLAELDADALDPSLMVLRTVRLDPWVDPHLKVTAGCGAPSGVALSQDESTAFVACRTTFSVQTVNLETGNVDQTRLFGSDPLSEDLAKGRRLFFDGKNPVISGGLSCSGCHPEGRDDGHTWHEATYQGNGVERRFTSGRHNIPERAQTRGFPRRTPMLAERLGTAGPYGWLGESPTLIHRLEVGFNLHRWEPDSDPPPAAGLAWLIGQFIRVGLKLPPREQVGAWERGKAIFESKEAGCATCHTAETVGSKRGTFRIPSLHSGREFEIESPGVAFKVPSLLGVAEHAPYFHDGSSSSLEHLIKTNGTRMGNTSQLSPEDASALVDYLRSL